MSRMSGDHFSESVTFEAEGLDDILKKVREARSETDLFHASQVRAGSAFGRGRGSAFGPPGFGPPPLTRTEIAMTQSPAGPPGFGPAPRTSAFATMFGTIPAMNRHQEQQRAIAKAYVRAMTPDTPAQLLAQEAKLKRMNDLAERLRRADLGFRGRFREDWHGRDGQPGYGSRLGAGARTAGNIALAGGVGFFGLGMAGMRGTVAGNQFDNQFQRMQHEIGNIFAPVVREATDWMKKFTDGLKGMSDRQKDYLSYIGTAVAGYAGLRAIGAEGPVHAVGGAIARGGLGLGLGGLGLAGKGLTALGGAMGTGAAGAAGIIAAPAAFTFGMARIHHGARDNMEAWNRRSWGKFTDEEIQRHQPEISEFAAIAKDEDRKKALLKRQREIQKEQLGLEDEYSLFGKMIGQDTVGGQWLGTYGKRKRDLDERMQLNEAQIRGDDLRIKQARDNPIAGGQFESFEQSYQRIESAFSKIAPAAGPAKPVGAIAAKVLAEQEKPKERGWLDDVADAADFFPDPLDFMLPGMDLLEEAIDPEGIVGVRPVGGGGPRGAAGGRGNNPGAAGDLWFEVGKMMLEVAQQMKQNEEAKKAAGQGEQGFIRRV